MDMNVALANSRTEFDALKAQLAQAQADLHVHKCKCATHMEALRAAHNTLAVVSNWTPSQEGSPTPKQIESAKRAFEWVNLALRA